MNHSFDLSVIVATYNERDSLPECLLELRDWSQTIPEKVQIVVVDSGSTDGTLEIARRWASEGEVLLINQGKRLGMGKALREAYDACEGEYICHYDADRPFKLNYVSRALDLLNNKNCDFVLGVRFGDRANWKRVAYTSGYRLFLNILFGPHADFETINYTFKVFRREILTHLHLDTDRWFIDAQLVLECLRNGFEVKELPVPYLVRSQGQSTVRFRDIFEIGREACRYAQQL